MLESANEKQTTQEKHPNSTLNSETSSSAVLGPANGAPDDENDHSQNTEIDIPSDVAGSGSLDQLVDKARDYAEQSTAENTNLA